MAAILSEAGSEFEPACCKQSIVGNKSYLKELFNRRNVLRKISPVEDQNKLRFTASRAGSRPAK